MTTADVRDVQTAMIWLAGSLHAATAAVGRRLLLGAAGTLILLTAGAADAALLGDRTAIGLGVRLQQLTLLRFSRRCCSPPPASPALVALASLA